ncbi:MAG TPA: protein translocase subunit SecF [Candidatus Angelobacter sp.]|nr:protein translocase subunit SecF [Candidatus Angelobacter sp.]
MYRGLHLIPHDTRIDFMRYHKVTFAFSMIMVVGSILLIAFKGLNFGVDFAGGILMEVTAPGPADLSKLRLQLTELGLGEVSLQQFGKPETVSIRLQHQNYGDQDLATVSEKLKTERKGIAKDELDRLAPVLAEQEAQQRAIKAVQTALGPTYTYDRTDFVGPKVGSELIQSAIWATVLALFGIMAYVWFRYEWQFGVNCLVALAHDCITTVGMFALIGWQFDLTTVAAVLTIAGYSVNDTVVIYDRIREELRRYKKMPLGELLSMSINRTLSRTVMTSGLTLLSVIAILFFGGEVLRGFSLAMTWGIVAGTYSTICVASPMLIYMNLRREKVGSMKPDAEKAASRP